MPNALYIDNETSILVNGEVGADVAWSVEGLTNGAGRVSAQKDWGAAPRASEFSWSCEVQLQATPTQYKTLSLYVATAPDGDSSQITGDPGTSDAALGDVDATENMMFIGQIVSENAAAGEVLVASGVFQSTERYHSYVIVNNTGASVNATDSNFRFNIQPKFVEVQ